MSEWLNILITVPLLVMGIVAMISAPLVLSDIADSKDVFIYTRPKLVRKFLMKNGFVHMEDLLCSLFETTLSDWRYDENGMVHHPFKSQKNLSFRFKRLSSVDDTYSLCLYYKNRYLLELTYDKKENELTGYYKASGYVAISDIKSFTPKARHLFKQLIPIREEHEQRIQDLAKKNAEIERVEKERKDALISEYLEKKRKILQTLLTSLSDEDLIEQEDFSVRFSTHAFAHFATFYYNKQPFVNVTHENGTCSVECLNQDRLWFPIFERELVSIQKACVERFSGKETFHPKTGKRIENPLVWAKFKEIEQLLERLKDDKEWLQADEYHIITNVYPKDVSVIIDTYSQLISPKTVEGKVLDSLQNIRFDLLRLASKAEESKKYLLEKQHRLTQVRQT